MKDKKQKNEQNAGAIAAKPKKKKKVLIVVLDVVPSAIVLVVWIGTSIHNATKQVAMAVNTVEVEPVRRGSPNLISG